MRGRRQLLGCVERWDGAAAPIPLEELLDRLGRLDLDPVDLADLVAFDDRSFRRVSVRRRPHYEMLILGWRSGQSSPIHDHAGSSCAVRVVSGRATETRYAESPCGLLVPRDSRSYPAGATLGCRGGGIHQLSNVEGRGQDLVTLHVYSPPPSGWRHYPLDRTTLAGNDRPSSDRPETLRVDLGHDIPGPPSGPKIRRRLPWKA